MEATLNKYDITWVEFRPLNGIATKADCKIMKYAFHAPRKYNGYAYVVFPSKENAIDYIECIKWELRRKNLSKKYEVRLFTDAQFRLTDLSKSEKGKGYPIEFTDKQNEEMITIW